MASFMDSVETSTQQPLPDLTAILHLRRGLLRRERVRVAVYALTENICVVKTDEAFMPGDDVRFALSLTMPFEDVTTSVLSGRIQGGRKYCSNFFYSFELKGFNKPQRSDIARILDFLGRKVALTDRRKDKLRLKSHQQAAGV